MRLKALFIAVLLSTLAVPAQAQDQLTPDGFLDIAVNRTLSFSSVLSGQLIGEEQFLRRDLSVWADKTGRCTYGRIEIRGPLLCFLYEDAPDPENCWIPFIDEGTLLVLATDSGETQRITDISDTPITCEGAPTS
ncbi:hypothetical protein [Sulfitobacter donghicola]|uniref:Uncharacterized protein n=1 Tax=Sulfitobacter donghicola DSW-25 = KCTC 12864 = JCM 14565 TaxID=1300350 RepID=A0A073IKL1_9RHOB|nr:hypothetical protein [Sulfitobacter donghicola]KEJ90011.1 hypothetical protein DSW25_07300 [Sulfitobacter donghicola DSW-25 = KCTC 12864 = JCM 14565]KIN66859.1 hypothetical protein Z948_563 [Sulfitobacter donghicola DSW-25 = KCTC 12864 = JCM 14565]